MIEFLGVEFHDEIIESKTVGGNSIELRLSSAFNVGFPFALLMANHSSLPVIKNPARLQRKGRQVGNYLNRNMMGIWCYLRLMMGAI